VPKPEWYCLRTGLKQEAKVAALLRKEIGVEVLSFYVRFRRLRKTAPIWVKEALFPGYVFARFDYVGQHRHVQAISGVAAILKFGEAPAVVPDAVIAELRLLSPANEVLEVNPALGVGVEVTVARGALRGLQSLITRILPARQRVAILLEILGTHREVEIESAHLLSRHPRRAVAIGSD